MASKAYAFPQKGEGCQMSGSALAISLLAWAAMFSAAVAGLWIGGRLPDGQRTSESRDLVRASMGMVSTLTAIALGLLISSANTSFNATQDQLLSTSTNIIRMDRVLRLYGPEVDYARQKLGAYATLCRRGELVAIRVEDFGKTDPDGSVSVLIRRSKADPFGFGRIAWVPPDAMRYVMDWMEAAGIEDGFVLRTVFGEKINDEAIAPYSISRRLKRLAEKAGLDAETVMLCLLSQHHRFMLKAMLASVTTAWARGSPIVLMKSFMRSFCSAKTCSIRARICDFVAFPLAIGFGIALPFGFL